MEGARDALPLDYRVPVPSAQVKSAVLLCGLNAPGITRIEEPEATRDHSENMLRHFGAERAGRARPGAGRIITLHGQPELRAADVVVPGDPSSAAFPIAGGAAGAGVAADHPWRRAEPAALRAVRDAGEMGADLVIENQRVEGGEPVGDLVVTHGALRGGGCAAGTRARA